MSDVLGTAFSVLNGFSQTGENPTQLLVEAFRRTQQQPINDLNARKSALESRQVFFNSLRTNLEGLRTQLENFTDATESLDKFRSKKATSSDTAVVSVSASATAVAGITTLKVDRLATNDILVSDRKNSADASGIAAGTKAFDISVNGVTSTVNVEFDGSETFEDAIDKIAAAINGVDDIGVSAGSINDTSSTVRLTLTAQSTGNDNSIGFTDTDGLLADFGIVAGLNADPQNRTAFTDTTAGFQQTDSSALDSLFQVNGINVTRDSNIVSDVLDGLTFTLVKPQDAADAAVTISTSINPQGVSGNIQPLLNSFNKVLQSLNNETSTRQDFALRSLQSNLRQLSSSQISSGEYKYLSDVGIKIATDGTLSVDNIGRLEDAITADPDAVANLFADFSAQAEARITNLLGDNGLISARRDSISDQIDRIDTRTAQIESRIELQAEGLRSQFETLQRTYLEAQQQFALLSSFSLGVSSTDI